MKKQKRKDDAARARLEAEFRRVDTDGSGELVPPGIYLVQVDVRTAASAETTTSMLEVAY